MSCLGRCDCELRKGRKSSAPETCGFFPRRRVWMSLRKTLLPLLDLLPLTR